MVLMMMSEEDAGKESVRRATAGREAWAAAVDPWRRVFSSKIPFGGCTAAPAARTG